MAAPTTAAKAKLAGAGALAKATTIACAPLIAAWKIAAFLFASYVCRLISDSFFLSLLSLFNFRALNSSSVIAPCASKSASCSNLFDSVSL